MGESFAVAMAKLVATTIIARTPNVMPLPVISLPHRFEHAQRADDSVLVYMDEFNRIGMASAPLNHFIDEVRENIASLGLPTREDKLIVAEDTLTRAALAHTWWSELRLTPKLTTG